MGNPNLFFIFNHGQLTCIIEGKHYTSRTEAINQALVRWHNYQAKWKELDPDSNVPEIESIQIYEIQSGPAPKETSQIGG